MCNSWRAALHRCLWLWVMWVVCVSTAMAIHGTTMFDSVNDSRLLPKNLRYADRMAKKLGTDVALQEFDEAAAAFSKPSPIVAATYVMSEVLHSMAVVSACGNKMVITLATWAFGAVCGSVVSVSLHCSILERDPVVMRAPEEWEAEFLEFQEMVDEKFAKEYPPEFVERQVAFAAKLEAESGGADAFQAADTPVAGVEATGNFDRFYAVDDADEDEEVGIGAKLMGSFGVNTRNDTCATAALTGRSTREFGFRASGTRHSGRQDQRSPFP